MDTKPEFSILFHGSQYLWLKDRLRCIIMRVSAPPTREFLRPSSCLCCSETMQWFCITRSISLTRLFVAVEHANTIVNILYPEQCTPLVAESAILLDGVNGVGVKCEIFVIYTRQTHSPCLTVDGILGSVAPCLVLTRCAYLSTFICLSSFVITSIYLLVRININFSQFGSLLIIAGYMNISGFPNVLSLLKPFLV